MHWRQFGSIDAVRRPLAVLAGLTVVSWNGIRFAEVARLSSRDSLGEVMAGAMLRLQAV